MRHDVLAHASHVGYQTEDSVGRAIRESALDRSDLYITTKWSGLTSIAEAINNSLVQVRLPQDSRLHKTCGISWKV